MSATYSINVGGPTEALKKQDINSVLLDLPDNTQKLISPKDVRDAFVTTWANSAFKQTIGQANIEYIGIDSGNPSDRDIKQKIFIGKRNYAGSDIMTNNLLNDTSSDIYIYNTKPDTYATQSTSIVILAGTNSSLHDKAPYIQSDVVNSGSALSLNFINPSLNQGPINIYSNTGRVSVNGILFPTLSETSISASNGKILKYYGDYPNGVLKWSNPDVSISSIGSIDSPMNIYGSPSNVNGYPLEFVSDDVVPQTIGGVTIGSSFSAGAFNGQNWPMTEVIRKILYPYVSPNLSLGITTSVTYLSTGLTHSSVFSYSVCRYSNPVYSYEIVNSTGVNIGLSGLSYSGVVGSCTGSTFAYDLYSDDAGTQSYTLQARDEEYSSGFSHSATSSVMFAHPLFYGFTMSNISNDVQLGSFMNSSNRYAVPYTGSSQSVFFNYNGSGYIYFVVPSDFPLISKIKDPNGFVVHDLNDISISSFTYSLDISPVGGNNLPNPIPSWKIYKTTATCSYTGTGKFEFIFL